MNSGELKQVPRLVAKLCDGSIVPDEMEQLNQQLLADPIAMESFIDHMEVDAMLEREFGGQPEPVLPSHPNAGEQVAAQSSRSSLTLRVTVTAIAVTVLTALGMFLSDWFRRSDEPLVPKSQPVAVQSSGTFQVRSPDGTLLPVAIGQPIPVGAKITTLEDAEFLLRYDDGTEIELSASTAIELGESSRDGKRLELQGGLLQADIARQPAGQPLVIKTPHTVVRVLGTRFELTADKEMGTRLELESGQVELVRENKEPVIVEPNSIAIVRSADEPILITARPSVIAAPDREAQFPRLHSFDFSSDGHTIVAMTDRGAIYWRADDEIETVRADTEADVKVVSQSGSLIVFEEKDRRRLVFWDAATGQTVRVIDDLDQIPDVFANEPREDKKPRFPSLRINAVSPRGDWIAVHKRDGGTDSMHLFDLDSGRTQVIERKHIMLSFRVSPDGSMLAIGQTMGQGKDGPAATVELFSSATGEPIREFVLLKGRDKLAPGIVRSTLTFSADGQRLAVGVRDWLQVWDVASGDRIVTIEDVEDIREIAVSPIGDWVAGTKGGDSVRLWRTDDPDDSIVLEPAGSHRSLRFSPDGQKLVAMLAGGRLWVWDFASTTTTDEVQP